MYGLTDCHGQRLYGLTNFHGQRFYGSIPCHGQRLYGLIHCYSQRLYGLTHCHDQRLHGLTHCHGQRLYGLTHCHGQRVKLFLIITSSSEVWFYCIVCDFGKDKLSLIEEIPCISNKIKYASLDEKCPNPAVKVSVQTLTSFS